MLARNWLSVLFIGSVSLHSTLSAAQATQVSQAAPKLPSCEFFQSKNISKVLLGNMAAKIQSASKPSVNYILISKSKRRMILFSEGKMLKTYKISLGKNPEGHKQEEGDYRTPEGLYKIEFKNWNSQFRRALKIDYPNARDRARARELGVSPGGNIMIHGEPNNSEKKQRLRDFVADYGHWDWTQGCIAVTDREIDEIYPLIQQQTPVRICR